MQRFGRSFRRSFIPDYEEGIQLLGFSHSGIDSIGSNQGILEQFQSLKLLIQKWYCACNPSWRMWLA